MLPAKHPFSNCSLKTHTRRRRPHHILSFTRTKNLNDDTKIPFQVLYNRFLILHKIPLLLAEKSHIAAALLSFRSSTDGACSSVVKDHILEECCTTVAAQHLVYYWLLEYIY